MKVVNLTAFAKAYENAANNSGKTYKIREHTKNVSLKKLKKENR